MAAIDFSRWNTLPWWVHNGYRTREEAWDDYGRTQRAFCALSASELEHQQRMAREINEKARKKC